MPPKKKSAAAKKAAEESEPSTGDAHLDAVAKALKRQLLCESMYFTSDPEDAPKAQAAINENAKKLQNAIIQLAYRPSSDAKAQSDNLDLSIEERDAVRKLFRTIKAEQKRRGEGETWSKDDKLPHLREFADVFLGDGGVTKMWLPMKMTPVEGGNHPGRDLEGTLPSHQGDVEMC